MQVITMKAIFLIKLMNYKTFFIFKLNFNAIKILKINAQKNLKIMLYYFANFTNVRV